MTIGDAVQSIDDREFWLSLGDDIKRQLAPIVGEIVQEGFNAALDVATTVDFVAAPDALVLQATTNYLDNWWLQLSRVRRDALRKALIGMQAGTIEGTGVAAVRRALEPLFDAERAALIAETETTRMFAEGAEAGYRALGVEHYEWQTAEDDLVDPVCADLNGKRFPVGQGPKPPAHPRCRCTTAPVEGGRALEPA